MPRARDLCYEKRNARLLIPEPDLAYGDYWFTKPQTRTRPDKQILTSRSVVRQLLTQSDCICVHLLTGDVDSLTDLTDLGRWRSVGAHVFCLGLAALRSLNAGKSGVQNAISNLQIFERYFSTKQQIWGGSTACIRTDRGLPRV